ncbi:hypothetical protein [Peptostreptococcus porci]|uniref:hypothetical protein n=1 Tax=Peptostreptococcus porci TaxID=2652282 RepID=UPI002A7FEC14|nr:hypothetical protein [Peptostreptococcus porci]MDY4127613.1 hypothetical protein [Peptostreptococcus porci]
MELYQRYESTYYAIEELIEEYKSYIKEDLLEPEEVKITLQEIKELEIASKWIAKLRDSEYMSKNEY